MWKRRQRLPVIKNVIWIPGRSGLRVLGTCESRIAASYEEWTFFLTMVIRIEKFILSIDLFLSFSAIVIKLFVYAIDKHF